jgi:OOP family OmpA-OmpF porin
MTHPHRLSLLSIAVCALLGAAPALAQDGSYPYGGVSVGSSKSKLDQDRQARQLLPSTAIVVGTDYNNQDTAFKVFGGYQFNPYFGLEGGYFDLGKFSYSTTTSTAAPATAGLLHSEKKVQGVNADVVGTLPFTPSFAVLGRVGLQHAKASTKLTSEGSAAIASSGTGKRETNYKLGVGLQYTFPNRVMLRGETERYRINDGVSGHGNINVFSLSLVLPFGRGSSSMRQTSAAPAPEPALYRPEDAPAAGPVVAAEPAAPPAAPVAEPPVAVAPEPAPVAAAPVVAPPPAPQRITLSTESLFSFDKADVQPEARGALDAFARELQGASYDSITVEGHADRIGTDAYNQTLSLQRAEAVKAYLVENGKLDASRITTIGRSESAPVTKAQDCKGETATSELVNCLKADRRVEIGVSGTR